eukprot:TRINITY_DN26994_c0_g2_i1.p1 TRINITY_DN26994_c0_g2~~TRINITY_DN26994_c0_g2_i1.p1  ORF type:complete len:827 (+),score=195.25 TRINITY_DN26994_c0_g2_i1:138-2618(+)
MAGGICQPGGGGTFFPLFGEGEHGWPNGLRVVLYMVGLFWTFLGVNIVADIFMAAIEAITSRKKVVTRAGRADKVTVKVWNDTVANLTLMALGSSAPEILLGCIEIIANDYYVGDLGPSTIVGSAAFNLLIISAVCVMVIPPGEGRLIKEVPVFVITAFFSMFSYLWLVIILVAITPNVVDITEAVLTFLFFPIMVILAFLADKGYFPCLGGSRSKEEGEEEEVQKVSYAQRRAENMQKILHRRASVNSADQKPPDVMIEFDSGCFEISPADKAAKLYISRIGSMQCKARVLYATESASAVAGTHFEEKSGEIVFEVGQAQAEIEIALLEAGKEVANMPTGENGEVQEPEFLVKLSTPEVVHIPPEESGHPSNIMLGEIQETTVKLVRSHGKPGQIAFAKSHVDVPAPHHETLYECQVLRIGGTEGVISCKFKTEKVTSVPDRDYKETSGTLEFHNGQSEAYIKVEILKKETYEHSDQFRLILEEPEGCELAQGGDGDEEALLQTVTILARSDSHNGCLRCLDRFMNIDEVVSGFGHWKEQFGDALSPQDPDSEDPPSAVDWVLHVLTLPWKLLFALIPPTTFFGGWLCFVVAIIFIGLVTAAISDLASLFGCTANMPDAVTAITFVALGTSLPDTFASKTAALQDPTADNSVGNITGSNSVNVFLGIGMPFMFAAFSWAGRTPSATWMKLFPEQAALYSPNAAFVVIAGDLTFGVIVFLITCVACLGTLALRRLKLGYELGGPPREKKATAFFFVMLWLFYIGLNTWKFTAGKAASIGAQAIAIVIGLAVVGVTSTIFTIVVMKTGSATEEVDPDAVDKSLVEKE